MLLCLVKIFEVRAAANEGDEENQLADLESKGWLLPRFAWFIVVTLRPSLQTNLFSAAYPIL